MIDFHFDYLDAGALISFLEVPYNAGLRVGKNAVLNNFHGSLFWI